MTGTNQIGSNTPAKAPFVLRRAPLVGRRSELRVLTEVLARSLSHSKPQVVTLIGAAGVGKSRLVYEFLQQVAQRDRTVRCFRGICQSDEGGYTVLRRILKARFGIAKGLDSEKAHEIFRTTVTEALGDKRATEFLHFLGAFLDLRFPESPFIKAIEEEPEQFSQLGKVILRRFFELDAAKAPLLLTFEDLHWASHEELEVINYLMNSVREVPIVLLCTARNELIFKRPEWFSAGQEHTKIELAPLDQAASTEMVRELVSDAGPVAEELIDVIVDMSGGTPYLVEQAVRTVFSSETLIKNTSGAWDWRPGSDGRRQLPISVEDAVSARISSLTPTERELLEMAASMGSVFWLGALVALGRIGKPAPELWGGSDGLANHYKAALDSLAERDYVIRLPDSMITGEPEYAFKHNLERETLQNVASPIRFREFQLIVAEWLEFRFSTKAEEHCEILAHLFKQGGARRKAAEYFIHAGDKARARFANYQSAEHYEKGLELLGDQAVLLKMHALHHLGDVLQLVGRNGEALVAFRKMLELAYRFDLKGKGGAAHNRIGRLYRATGQLESAMRHLGTAHALFEAAEDRRGVASSFDDVGKVHWMRGSYEPAEKFILQGLAIRRELDDDRSIALSYNNLGLVYQDSGRLTEARDAFERALELWRGIGDLAGISQSLNNLGTLYQDLGDNNRANELWTESLNLAKEIGDSMRQAVIYTNLGESYARLNDSAMAIRMLDQAAEIAGSLGDRILEADVFRGLARAHLVKGDLDQAALYVDRAIKVFERTNNKPFLAVSYGLAGEILGQPNGHQHDPKKASDYFERAIDILKQLGNSIELSHCYRSYAAFLTRVQQEEKAGLLLKEADKVSSMRAEPSNASV